MVLFNLIHPDSGFSSDFFSSKENINKRIIKNPGFNSSKISIQIIFIRAEIVSVRSYFLYEEKLVNFANIIKVECQSQMLKSEENVDLDKVEMRQVQVNEAKRNQILSNISYKSFDFQE